MREGRTANSTVAYIPLRLLCSLLPTKSAIRRFAASDFSFQAPRRFALLRCCHSRRKRNGSRLRQPYLRHVGADFCAVDGGAMRMRHRRARCKCSDSEYRQCIFLQVFLLPISPIARRTVCQIFNRDYGDAKSFPKCVLEVTQTTFTECERSSRGKIKKLLFRPCPTVRR